MIPSIVAARPAELLGQNVASMKSKVLDTIRRHDMIRERDRVVVAVSGGPDSMALLHVLVSLLDSLDVRPIGAHLDHGIRDESARDERFVAEFCRTRGIAFISDRVETVALASDMRVSLEEAGRIARYEFFERVRKETDSDRIAVGHHRDDLLETFFLRLVRGSSLTGLGAIRPVRGPIVRPLIECSRDDILAYCERNSVSYLTDPTNEDIAIDRNFVRHRVLPLLDERFPGFRGSLNATLELVRRDEAFLQQQAERLYDECFEEHETVLVCRIDPFLGAAPSLSSRALRSALYRIAGPYARLSRFHIQAVMDLAAGDNPSAELHLPAGIRVRREYDRLIICPEDLGFPDKSFHVIVEGPGAVDIPEADMVLRFRVRPADSGEEISLDGTNVAVFDADMVGFPLVVRSPEPGDRLEPWGMAGSRKIKDILIDLKIPVSQRRAVPAVVHGRTVLWIPGIRRSRFAPVGPTTRRILEISVD